MSIATTTSLSSPFAWNIFFHTFTFNLCVSSALKWVSHMQHIQFSVTQSCPTLCDPMDHSTPDLPVHHQLPEYTQIHVHWVGDAIQPYHPLSSPSPPAFDLSQHQGLFKLKLLSPLEVTTPHFGAAAPALCNGPHSVCGVCLSLHKSAAYLSLCLSLNSFCNKTSRTWASLGPETRYCEFWLGLSPSTWIQVPTWGKQFHIFRKSPSWGELGKVSHPGSQKSAERTTWPWASYLNCLSLRLLRGMEFFENSDTVCGAIYRRRHAIGVK